MAKLSGLQKEVIRLYRACIRQSYKKPIENQGNFRKYIRQEFGKYRDLPRRDFTTVEHLLRTGHRRFEMFSQEQIRDIN
ncbi:Sdh6p ASCRUDRAFT_74341 [Ascoidea rubescens DSM 1968]|uniref:Complex 1 LYR protein domain-containing protein n=1 Tax=Ascoidea rubescens DSM 1968 TaxID=1344418 RepID=A0A1D2VMV8_9ASCO|nr:hypothetical protein ASCRUDRAFT_74341 [Ascoidea rubescens DSM 1968]ODV62885.1 hypothetical protein ASCRUDRAFT_74341 [Ascoidea rubescens DSM 1968]